MIGRVKPAVLPVPGLSESNQVASSERQWYCLLLNWRRTGVSGLLHGLKQLWSQAEVRESYKCFRCGFLFCLRFSHADSKYRPHDAG
jgi:hypothetical protein